MQVRKTQSAGLENVSPKKSFSHKFLGFWNICRKLRGPT